VRILSGLDAGDFGERRGIEETDVSTELVDHYDAALAGGVIEAAVGNGRSQKEKLDKPEIHASNLTHLRFADNAAPPAEFLRWQAGS
jgi:hypothetical protein